MFKKQAGDQGQTLPNRVAAQIAFEHLRHARGGTSDLANMGIDIVLSDGHPSPIRLPVDVLAYSPRDGKYSGSAGAIDDKGRPLFEGKRYVLVADNWHPAPEDIAAKVRVLDDGTVTVDGVVGGILHAPPVAVPEPEPIGPPTGTAGLPLPEATIRKVIAEWRTVVSRAASAARPPGWAPVYELAFTAADGRYCGTSMTVGVMEHREELIVLRDDEPPTVELLQRVRRHSNGVVTWAESEPAKA